MKFTPEEIEHAKVVMAVRYAFPFTRLALPYMVQHPDYVAAIKMQVARIEKRTG